MFISNSRIINVFYAREKTKCTSGCQEIQIG